MRKFFFLLLLFCIILPVGFSETIQSGKDVCTWEQVKYFDNWPNTVSMTKISRNSQGWMFLGTSNNQGPPTDLNIWRTTTANSDGTQWESRKLPDLVSKASIDSIEASPFNSVVVAVASSTADMKDYTFVSMDNGNSWSLARTDNANDGFRKIKFAYDGPNSAIILAVQIASNTIWEFGGSPGNYIFAVKAQIPGVFGFNNLVSFPDGTSFVLGSKMDGKAVIYKTSVYNSLGNWIETTGINENGTGQDIIKVQDGYIALIKVGTDIKIYRSTNNGYTWSFVKTISGVFGVTASAYNASGGIASFTNKLYRFKTAGTEAINPENIALLDFQEAYQYLGITTADNHTFYHSNNFKTIARIKCNSKPDANAGNDQSVQTGTTVFLNGTVTDYENDSYNIGWAQDSGPTVSLTNSTTLTPNFTPTVAGTYVFHIAVNDNATPIVNVATDTVTVTITQHPNSAPIANAGNDKQCTLNQECIMEANISDPDNDDITVLWTKTIGPNIQWEKINGTDSNYIALARFIPTTAGTYVISVTVTDDEDAIATDIVTITVPPAGNGPVIIPVVFNEAPNANAGKDQQVKVGDLVTLNGSLSNDPEGQPLLFYWEKTSGQNVILSNPNSPDPSFSPSEIGVIVFRLTVTDNNANTDTDIVNIIVNPPSSSPPVENNNENSTEPENRPPIVSVTKEIEAIFGEKILLSCIAADPENGQLNYAWKQIIGTEMVLADKNLPTASFVATKAGIFEFEITVTDSDSMQTKKRITVIVTEKKSNNATSDDNTNENSGDLANNNSANRNNINQDSNGNSGVPAANIDGNIAIMIAIAAILFLAIVTVMKGIAHSKEKLQKFHSIEEEENAEKKELQMVEVDYLKRRISEETYKKEVAELQSKLSRTQIEKKAFIQKNNISVPKKDAGKQ